MRTARVFKDGQEAPILHNVQIADNLWTRFWGLMGRARLGDCDGLLITSSSSVHTMFMRFTIDVVYLDREGRVTKVATVRPFRASFGRGARQVLELEEGQADRCGIKQGDTLRIVSGE